MSTASYTARRKGETRTVGHARVGLPDVGLQDTDTDAKRVSCVLQSAHGAEAAHLPSESMLGWYILLVNVI